jgi:fermentation-respiration switch protein FrsA (DUF1100 family)
VLQDDNDPLTPESDATRIYGARADPTRREIYLAPSEGHGGHGDAIYLNPQTYATTVLEFLARNLPGASAINQK